MRQPTKLEHLICLLILAPIWPLALACAILRGVADGATAVEDFAAKPFLAVYNRYLDKVEGRDTARHG